MRHNPDRGIMSQFVQAGPIIVDLLEKGRLRRHLHHIERRHIISLVTADSEIDTACRDDCLCYRDNFTLG